MARGDHSSSDLSSPNETCYSFVRRAIQKMSTPVRKGEEQSDSEGGTSSAVETRFPWLSLAKLEQFTMTTASEAGIPGDRSEPCIQVNHDSLIFKIII